MQCLKRLSLRLRVSEEHKIGSIKGNAHQQQLLYTPTATMYGCCMGGDSRAFIIAQRQLQNYQKIKQLRLSLKELNIRTQLFLDGKTQHNKDVKYF